MPASLFPSVIRTAVPLVAGWLLSLAVKAGITISSDKVTSAVTIGLALAYYLAFRLLEVLGTKLRGSKLQTLAGLLLGWARPPAYPSADDNLPPVTPVTGAYRSDV
jgi:hypothetical protein